MTEEGPVGDGLDDFQAGGWVVTRGVGEVVVLVGDVGRRGQTTGPRRCGSGMGMWISRRQGRTG